MQGGQTLKLFALPAWFLAKHSINKKEALSKTGLRQDFSQ